MCVSVYIPAGVTEFGILHTAIINIRVNFSFRISANSPYSVNTSHIILRTNRDYSLSLCDISGSHSGAAEGMSLLGCDAVSLGMQSSALSTMVIP